MKQEQWNRCDICGRYIPIKHFINKSATRRIRVADNHFNKEDFETLCKKHTGWSTENGKL